MTAEIATMRIDYTTDRFRLEGENGKMQERVGIIHGGVAMKKILFLLILFSFFVNVVVEAAQAKNPYNLTRYVASDGSYALFKPAGWSVIDGSKPGLLNLDVLDPSKTSRVTFSYGPNGPGYPTSLHFMTSTFGILKKAFPDIAISDIIASKDKMKSCATVSYKDMGVLLKGRCYFLITGKNTLFLAYNAPAQKLASSKGLLLTIASNVTLLNQSAYNQAWNNYRKAAQAAPAYNPILLQCAWRQAPDGSSKMIVPVNWDYLAARGTVLTCSKDGNWGFIFTSINATTIDYGVNVPTVIKSPYMPPAQFLPVIFSHFKTGFNVKITDRFPDNASNYQFPLMVGQQCVAEDLQASYLAKSKTPVLGAFKLINSYPSFAGPWYSIMTGFWAPEKEFYRYASVLSQIGQSFSIDDNYSRTYILSGLQNLERLKQKTAAAVQGLVDAVHDNQAAWEERQKIYDYIDWNRSQTIRGESDWVSGLEGGKVYHSDSWGTTDTQTGDHYRGSGYNYVNFEGSNPRYNENMQQINSYELWKKYKN